MKIGELAAQKWVLIALQAGKPSKELVSKFETLQRSFDTSNTALAKFANDTEDLRQKCLISRIPSKAGNGGNITVSEDCKKYAEASGNAFDIVSANTELYASVEDLDYQINGYEEAKIALGEMIQQIDEQIDALGKRLATADIKFSHLARDAQHAADTQDQLDSKWLSFAFDSSRETRNSFSSYSRKTSQVAASGGASGLFWSARASFSRSSSKTESSFEASMNSAETSVSGQVLRVTIQRPWFRPSIFKSKEYQIRVSYGYMYYTRSPCIKDTQPSHTLE